ncbi:CHAT domain-containing protein [Streptomyces osmaniensis]|uniref:CHAT domain-containing protein n=1 Tax=Streptomyces osmaniensis TaxID=593134 RepID=UPI001C335330|nr:CHAT domain-containing protein [Streptomyces sp. JCM17656]
MLDDEAVNEASGLMQEAGPPYDVEVVHVVASLHWARHHAQVPPGVQGSDYRIALSLFQLLRASRPDLVPAELEAVVQELQVPDNPQELAEQALRLSISHFRSGDLGTLDAAIDLFQRASDAARTALERGTYLANVCSMTTRRAQCTKRLEDADRAVAVGRRAVAIATREAAALCLGYFGVALHQRYDLFEDLADSDAGIAMMRDAIEAGGADHSHRVQFTWNLGVMLANRYHRTRDEDDLEDGIASLQGALDLPTVGDMASTVSASLGTLLLERWDRGGDPADFDRAIGLARAAPGHPDLLTALGARYRRRFGRHGDIGDLDEAIRLTEAAVAATPPRHKDRPTHLGNLSAALRVRYAATGADDDLDRAIETGQRASEAIPADHDHRAMIYTDLMIALRMRYERTGSRDDLRAALLHGMTAFESDGADNATVLSNISVTARLQAEVTGASAMAQTAVYLARKALERAAEDDPARHTYLANLATALTSWADFGDDADRSDEAIQAARAAVEATPARHPDLPGRRSNLANGLMKNFRRTNDPEVLDEALSEFRACLDSAPQDIPVTARVRFNLAQALRARFDHDGDPESLYQAVRTFQEVADQPGAPTQERFRARVAHADLCMQGSPTDAAESYRIAIEELLPRLAWRGLDRFSQLYQLGRFPGLASDAAAAALTQGDPEQALRLLEQGRSVLWAHLMETRGDWKALSEQYPQLAVEFNEVCRLLDLNVVHFGDASRQGMGEQASEYAPAALTGRLRMAERHAGLLARIRALPGFDTFLSIPRFAELRRAANGGPVVVVNVSRHRCDALVLRPGHDDVLVVPLPALEFDEVLHRAHAFVQATAGTGSGSVDPGWLIHSRQTLLATTEWLWDQIVGPVLDSLLPDDSAAEPGLQRVWWCPTGPLGLLPLHAAGHHPGGVTTADRVISSYTPTLGALIHARSRPPAASGSRRVLAVGMSSTPPSEDEGLGDLPAVPQELQTLRERLGDDLLVLRDEQARCDRVKAAMRNHPWVHFACHGTHDSADPTRSGIVLGDGRLSVLDIAAEPVEGAELAFLSACHTARGRVDVADEAMHVAAAFHMAGYRHVIGTLWAVRDPIAPKVARAVYAGLGENASAAAVALHDAVTELRTGANPAPLATWASYLHIGP